MPPSLTSQGMLDPGMYDVNLHLPGTQSRLELRPGLCRYVLQSLTYGECHALIVYIHSITNIGQFTFLVFLRLTPFLTDACP